MTFTYKDYYVKSKLLGLYQTENITYKNLYNFTERFPDAYEYKNYQKEKPPCSSGISRLH